MWPLTKWVEDRAEETRCHSFALRVTDLCTAPQVLSLVDIKRKPPVARVCRDGPPAGTVGWQYSFQGGIHCFGKFTKILSLEDQDRGFTGFPISAPLAFWASECFVVRAL